MKQKMKLSLIIAAVLVLNVPALGSDPNLVAHWTFDEGTGSIAYDSAGSNDGTLVNGPIWTSGQIDGALELDGSNDYVDCGDTFASVTASTTKSIMGWAKSNDGLAANILIFYRKSDSSTCFRITAEGDPVVWRAGYMKSATTVGTFDSGISVAVNEWAHVALVQDGTYVAIYINGELANSVNDGTAPAMSNPINATIGTYFYGGPSGCFNGAIDDVRIYDKALSAEGVELLYLEGLGGSEGGIMAVESAIVQKLEAVDAIDAALAREWVAYDALEELLASGDYEGLSKRDIDAAQREIESAIRRQERSKRVVLGSIEELENALLSLGWEPEPESNEPEPNMPVPGKLLRRTRKQR